MKKIFMTETQLFLKINSLP